MSKVVVVSLKTHYEIRAMNKYLQRHIAVLDRGEISFEIMDKIRVQD